MNEKSESFLKKKKKEYNDKKTSNIKIIKKDNPLDLMDQDFEENDNTTETKKEKKTVIEVKATENKKKNQKSFFHKIFKIGRRTKVKHDIVKKNQTKPKKSHSRFKKGNRLFVVVQAKSCDFCIKSPQGIVVDRAYCDSLSQLDAIEDKLRNFNFYEAIIIIDTHDIKFEYFTAPPLNALTRESFMRNKLKGAMANFPIKSYFFDCDNPNKTGNYILMGLNINDFIITIIQFIDDRLDLYIPYFLFSNIELTNILIDIRKKIDDAKAWDNINKLLIIRYDENNVRLILTRNNHFLFSRDISYRIAGKLEEDCKQLSYEINGLQSYAIRTFNLKSNEFVHYCISIDDQNDYLRQMINNEKVFSAVTFFSLQDLKINADEKHFINNIFIQDELFRHTVKFQTQKINTANQFVLLRKITVFAVIVCLIASIAIFSINGFIQFHAFIKKVNLTAEFMKNDVNYQNMMQKLGYDASEIINIRNMINIYRDKINHKQCSLLEEIFAIGEHDFKNFSINSFSLANKNNNNEINISIALHNNEEEFFKILSKIDEIERKIESNKEISNFELTGLPAKYSLSAVYSDLDLKIKYLKKICYEN